MMRVIGMLPDIMEARGARVLNIETKAYRNKQVIKTYEEESNIVIDVDERGGSLGLIAQVHRLDSEAERRLAAEYEHRDVGVEHRAAQQWLNGV